MSSLHRNSVLRRFLLWLQRPTHHGNRSSTGHSDKAPVLNQNLPEEERYDRPRTFYPSTAFLLGTRPFCWKGACRRTVSLWLTRVPKPTRSYSNRWSKNRKEERPKVPPVPQPKTRKACSSRDESGPLPMDQSRGIRRPTSVMEIFPVCCWLILCPAKRAFNSTFPTCVKVFPLVRTHAWFKGAIDGPLLGEFVWACPKADG